MLVRDGRYRGTDPRHSGRQGEAHDQTHQRLHEHDGEGQCRRERQPPERVREGGGLHDFHQSRPNDCRRLRSVAGRTLRHQLQCGRRQGVPPRDHLASGRLSAARAQWAVCLRDGRERGRLQDCAGRLIDAGKFSSFAIAAATMDVKQSWKSEMLPSQRALFDLPREVCYLNAASYSPLPLKTMEAGRAAVARKGRPWLIDHAFATAQYERTRKAAAALINAAPEDVALTSSVGYGVATAAKILNGKGALPTGSLLLVLADDHSSAVLEWIARAGAEHFTVEIVRATPDGDWTAAVLAAIERPGAAPIALASISSAHWSDGGTIDLTRVAPALRAQGA